MSNRGVEVTEFIGANERYLEQAARRKPARDLAEGDVVVIPGAELHDDLAGLIITTKADAIDRRDGYVHITDGHEGTIWFEEDEVVRIDESTYASSRLV
jgi:hypothetical protein